MPGIVLKIWDRDLRAMTTGDPRSSHQQICNAFMRCSAAMWAVMDCRRFFSQTMFCAPDYFRMRRSGFREWHGIESPRVPPRWERGDIVEAAQAGIRLGVWHPEHHGYTHCSVPYFLRKLRPEEGTAIALAEQQMWPLYDPGIHAEYAQPIVVDHVVRGVQLFADLFGYRPQSTIPPNYIWDRRMSGLFRQTSIHVLQGTARYHLAANTGLSRLLWWLNRRVLRSVSGVHRVERHVDFEPRGQDPHACDRPVWRATFAGIIAQLRHSSIAVVSTHRPELCSLR